MVALLIVGGGAKFKYTGPVTLAELFDPATETWTPMAAQQGGRMYHSTALLLPDGRVLSAGRDNGALATSAEIFSPPYLFRGARPVITGAPAAVRYGQPMSISTPDAADIRSVTVLGPARSRTASTPTSARSRWPSPPPGRR